MTVKSTKIETQDQAAALVEAIATWLHAHKLATPNLDEHDEASAQTLARRWSSTLLEYAQADGLGGCPLCQS